MTTSRNYDSSFFCNLSPEYKLLLHQDRNYNFARLHFENWVLHRLVDLVWCYVFAIHILLFSSFIILFLILQIYHSEVSRVAASMIKISIPFEDLTSRYLTLMCPRPRSYSSYRTQNAIPSSLDRIFRLLVLTYDSVNM